MSTPEAKSGKNIAALFKRPDITSVIVKSEKHGPLEFKVKPMNNRVYAEMISAMNMKNVKNPKTGVSKELVAENIDPDAIKVLSEAYYPAINVVLPACCVDPKIDFEGGDGIICIDDMDLDIEILLLEQILQISGLTQDGAENRKN